MKLIGIGGRYAPALVAVFLLAASSSAATLPSTRPLPAAPAPPMLRPHAATSCTGAGTYSFVGVANQNYAYGYASSVVDGYGNTACDDYSSIVNGYGNTVSSFGRDSAAYSAIVTGYDNSSSGYATFIGGGFGNQISATAQNSSSYSSILGGYENTIAALSANGGNEAAIAGGYRNTVNGEYGFIGAGSMNSVSGTAAVIAGGYDNQARGGYAVVPGGYGNNAYGEMSFAAGYKSQAVYPGTFVWSDYSCCSSLTATASNQFLARASGGFTLYSNPKQTCGVRLLAGGSSWTPVPGCATAKASPASGDAPAEIAALHGEIARIKAQNDALQRQLDALAAASR